MLRRVEPPGQQGNQRHLLMALHNLAVIQYQLGEWTSSIGTAQAIQHVVQQPEHCARTENIPHCQLEAWKASLFAARTEMQARRASGAWTALVDRKSEVQGKRG